MNWKITKLLKNRFTEAIPFFLFLLALATGGAAGGDTGRNIRQNTQKISPAPQVLRRRNATESAAAVADEYLTRAAIEEPEITGILTSLENSDFRLDGLEHRLKSRDSLTRKILKRSRENGTGIRDAADGISDLLRYTCVTAEDKYAETVTRTLKKLSRAGIQTAVCKNVWGGSSYVYDREGKQRSAPDPNQYQGTNVVLRTPDNIPVEIQFHTETSFRTKEATHRFYEVIRSQDSSPEEKAEAIRQQAVMNARIPVPEGARDLRFPV